MDLKLEYEKDFHQWIEYHIQILRENRLNELDIDHLIDELEGMADRDRNELVSHLVILLANLLKWQFQLRLLSGRWQELDGKNWRRSIIEQRFQVAHLLKNIPSLKKNLNDAVMLAHPDAVKIAMKETELSQSTFPSKCPYTLEQLLDDDFYPA